MKLKSPCCPFGSEGIILSSNVAWEMRIWCFSKRRNMFRNWTNMSSTLENDAWGMRAVVALHHFGNISDCGSIDHIFHLHGKDMATLIASISYTYFLHISGKMASNHILQYSAENMLYCKMYSAPPIGNRHTMHLTSDKLIDFSFSTNRFLHQSCPKHMCLILFSYSR